MRKLKSVLPTLFFENKLLMLKSGLLEKVVE